MTDKGVTIWHKTSDGYKRRFFEKVSFVKTCKVLGGGSEQTKKNDVLVRVYSLKNLDICAGDRLCRGYDEAYSPPEDCYIISEVTEFFNCSARLSHYKLKCI